MTKPDVLIAGAGIIGCSLALRLAEEKLSVLVLDRGQPGHEASWAAAGMLAPTSEHGQAAAEKELAEASAALYPSWIAKLEERIKEPLGYRSEGTLVVAFSADEAGHLAALPGEALTAAEARHREPALNERLVAARFLPGDRQVDNRRVLQALLVEAVAAGVEFRAGAPVVEWWIESGRMRGVRTAAGERLEAGAVVNALGGWAGTVPPLGRRFAPARPVRGQMLALQASPDFLRHVVRSPRGYLVPRQDGRLLVGSTMEEAGYDKSVTPAGLRGLLAAAVEIAPGVASLPFSDAWAGLRPDTPDHLPILGATEVKDYFLASGHFRNGILLAAITAELLTEVILGRPPRLALAPFSPLRWA
jgi:glycine oxidase